METLGIRDNKTMRGLVSAHKLQHRYGGSNSFARIVAFLNRRVPG